jgi:YbbR domain-containing protein
MVETLFGNPHYKLVALLAAILAWLYVQSDEVATGQIQAKVSWTLASGLVSVEPLPRNVALQVRGTRAAIRRARLGGPELTVDLRDLGPGEHNLELGPFPVTDLDGKVEVLSRTPSGLRFRLDREVTRKVALEARFVGEPTEGFAVDQVELTPSVVEVTGPASVVRRVDRIATEPIDVADQDADLTTPVALAMPARLERIAGEIQAVVRIVALNEPRRLDGVPVQVYGGGGLVRPPTTSVDLVGPSSAVRELDPRDVVVLVDVPAGSGPVRATFGEPGAATVRVLHSAGSEVRATALTPATFEVIR